MAGADDSAGEKNRGGKQGTFGGESGLNQAKTRKEKCDHRGGENFEEALNPEVNHPPAPIFDDGEVRVLAPGESSAVEKTDRRGGHEEKPQERLLFAAELQGGTDGAHDKEKPDQETQEEKHLPAAAEVDVFIALMTPEKRRGGAQLVVDAHPFAGQRAKDNQKKRAEKHGDDPHQNLHQDQCRDDPEILQRGALRRSGLPVDERIGGRDAG